MAKWRRLYDIDIQNCPLEGLLSLPVELHLLIICQLRFLDVQSLRITNRHFHSLIKPATFEDAVAYELDPEEHDTCIVKGCFGSAKYMWIEDLTCSHCRKLRPRWEFVPHARHEKPEVRKCMDCQVRCRVSAYNWVYGGPRRRSDKIYSPYIWCKSCGKITQEYRNESCLECATIDEVKDWSAFKKERAWKVARRGTGRKGQGLDFDLVVAHVVPWNGRAACREGRWGDPDDGMEYWVGFHEL